jgi:uncharacterized heparinase superfamily protein
LVVDHQNVTGWVARISVVETPEILGGCECFFPVSIEICVGCFAIDYSSARTSFCNYITHHSAARFTTAAKTAAATTTTATAAATGRKQASWGRFKSWILPWSKQ